MMRRRRCCGLLEPGLEFTKARCEILIPELGSATPRLESTKAVLGSNQGRARDPDACAQVHRCHTHDQGAVILGTRLRSIESELGTLVPVPGSPAAHA